MSLYVGAWYSASHHVAPYKYDIPYTKTTYVAQATCISFFEKIKNIILKFQENLKLNLHVDNVVIYSHANF
jgi:hypothetical protein